MESFAIDFRAEGVHIYLPLPESTVSNDSREIIEGTLYLIVRDRVELFIVPVLVDFDKEAAVRELTAKQHTQDSDAAEQAISETQPSVTYLDKLRRAAFSFELRELNSIKQHQLNPGDRPKLTFIQRDGTTRPTVIFCENNVDLFLQALQRHVWLYRSAKDNNLLIVRHYDPNPFQLSLLSDLLIRNPYGATLGGLAKVGGIVREVVLNPKSVTTIDELEKLMGNFPRHASPSPSHGSCSNIPEIASSFDASSKTKVVYKVSVPPRLPTKRGSPVTLEQWLSFFDREGRIRDLDRLLDAIFRGGLAHDYDGTSVRRDAYKFLLGYYSWDSTDAERAAVRQAKHVEYRHLKQQWMFVTPDQETRWTVFRDRKCLVEKDVTRTDRAMEVFKEADSKALKQLSDILMTYIMYNFDLGYVQGMNDLLAPLLLIMQDEADAFWCFVGFMNIVGKNFDMDQKELNDQLNNLYILLEVLDPCFAAYLDSHDCSNMCFCFRWLLLWFKREFTYADTLRLWEVFWTRRPCTKNFHLLVCLAIFDIQKVVIVENNFGVAEILKHMNNLALNLDVDEILRRAEGIFIQFCGCPELPSPVKNILGI